MTTKLCGTVCPGAPLVCEFPAGHFGRHDWAKSAVGCACGCHHTAEGHARGFCGIEGCNRAPCPECGGRREVTYGTSDGLKCKPCPTCRGDILRMLARPVGTPHGPVGKLP